MGHILVVLSALFFSLSSYFGKIVTNTTDMSGVITSFSRFLIGTIMMSLYILISKKSFRPNYFKPIVRRAIFNSFAIILLSSALNFTTITNANMLNMTYPVFVILLAPIILKEKISKSTYFYLIAIMLGSYIIADPQFGSINKGDLMGFGSSVMAGISVLSLKEASNKNEGYIIVFYVMLIGTAINIPFCLEYIMNFDYSALFIVIISGGLGFLAQVLLTEGYKYVDSATGSLLSASRIVMSAIIGIILLGEPLDLRIIIGIVLIGGSLVGLSGYFEKKKTLDISNKDINDWGK